MVGIVYTFKCYSFLSLSTLKNVTCYLAMTKIRKGPEWPAGGKLLPAKAALAPPQEAFRGFLKRSRDCNSRLVGLVV